MNFKGREKKSAEVLDAERLLVKNPIVGFLKIGKMLGMDGNSAMNAMGKAGEGVRNITDFQCASNVLRNKTVSMRIIEAEDMETSFINSPEAIVHVRERDDISGAIVYADENKMNLPKPAANIKFAPCRTCSCDYKLTQDYIYIDYANDIGHICPKVRFIFAELLEKYLLPMVHGLGFPSSDENQEYTLVVKEAVMRNAVMDFEKLARAVNSKERA